MNRNLPFSITKVGKTKTCRCKHQVNWSYQQLCRYTIYLHTFLQENHSQSKRSLTRNQLLNMSEIVGSRNLNQCRIFHAKMMQIHSSIPELFKMFTENIKQYPQIWAKHQETLRKVQPEPQQACQPIFQQQSVEFVNKKDNESEPTGTFYEAIQLNPPLTLGRNFSQSEAHKSIKMDWFDEFDEFLDDINGSWLDDI